MKEILQLLSAKGANASRVTTLALLLFLGWRIEQIRLEVSSMATRIAVIEFRLSAKTVNATNQIANL